MLASLPLWFGLLSACAPPGPPGPTVVLVTWDTTRADALSAWVEELPGPAGAPAPRTPNADALAARGVRFSWALAHAPTTLSSHTSIMSGEDPHGHGVPRNGFPVRADLPLFAERFQAAGWQTRAVVGASSLAADMGLSRGFDAYDDAVGTRVRLRYEDPADRVTERALASVHDARRDRPLFLFVHYFDAHSPWSSAPDDLQATFVDDLSQAVEEPAPLIAALREGRLSAAQSRRARGLYLAEVSWADQALGELLAGLDAEGRLADSLVVLAGDHGEALDDVGLAPYGHGLDADLAAIHVPLIIAGRGRFATPEGAVVAQPVRLMDVAPTVLGRVLPGTTIGHGRDLAPTWSGATEPAPPSFAEATKPHELPRSHDGWNNLVFDRSVAFDGYLLTRTPWQDGRPQLFHLAAGQPVAAPDPDRVAALDQLLTHWDAAAPPWREEVMEEDTRRALEALGYVEGAGKPRVVRDAGD